MHVLGLQGIAKAFTELDNYGDAASLSHAEWLALLLDRETTWRHDKRLSARLIATSAVTITPARLSMLLEGINAPARADVYPEASRLKNAVLQSFFSYAKVTAGYVDTDQGCTRIQGGGAHHAEDFSIKEGLVIMNRVFILTGFAHMSEERVNWIRDFLSLFEIALQPIVNGEIFHLHLDANSPYMPDILANDIIIGHEIPEAFCHLLSELNARYIDIRISPVRFLQSDNLFAIRSNDTTLQEILLLYKFPDHDVFVEALALKLSFRYRDFGQNAIVPGSIIIFTEQLVDHNSIHYNNIITLESYHERLLEITKSFNTCYYVHRGSDSDRDPMLLRSMGIRRCDANIYAILSSSHIGAIAAIRSGVLEEARYFGISTFPLGNITTPLAMDDNTADNSKFVNILPCDALSRAFWNALVHRTFQASRSRTTSNPPAQNLIRRALNNWNSAAVGLELEGQPWQDLVNGPIKSAVQGLRDEMAFRIKGLDPDQDSHAICFFGSWRWFTGEIVVIESNGYVRSAIDYGRIDKDEMELSLHWQKRGLTDVLIMAPDQQSFVTRNQYGDGGLVRRIVE